MTDSLSNFENTLRQFKPTSCDERLPETFYQAGWDACEQANKSAAKSRLPVPVPVSTIRRVQNFGTGLLCGVLASAGISAAGLWQMEAEPSTQIVSEEVIKQESVVAGSDGVDERVDGVESAIAANQVEGHQIIGGDAIALPDWNSITSIFSPWNGLQATPSANLDSPATLPLSIAARQQWSFVVASRNATPSSGVHSEAIQQQSLEKKAMLSTSPLTEKLLLELL